MSTINPGLVIVNEQVDKHRNKNGDLSVHLHPRLHVWTRFSCNVIHEFVCQTLCAPYLGPKLASEVMSEHAISWKSIPPDPRNSAYMI